MVWEVYLDKKGHSFCNDNYSCFIRSDKKPTKEQAKNVLKKHNAFDRNYYINFIIESTWEDIDEKDIWSL